MKIGNNFLKINLIHKQTKKRKRINNIKKVKHHVLLNVSKRNNNFRKQRMEKQI